MMSIMSSYAVAVVEGDTVVGHVPHLISAVCYLLYQEVVHVPHLILAICYLLYQEVVLICVN